MPNPIVPSPQLSGDAFTITLTFWSVAPTNPADPTTGTVENLTGQTVGCTIKTSPTDVDSAAMFKDDLPGDTTGIIIFSVPGLAAGSYWVDVKQWNSSNVRTSVIAPQQFLINQSITQRATPELT